MVVKSEYPGNERRVSTGLEAGRGCRNAAARRLRDGGADWRFRGCRALGEALQNGPRGLNAGGSGLG